MTLTGGNCRYCGLEGGHRPNCTEHPNLPEGWRVANLMAHELMRAFPMQRTYVDSVQAARVVADELLEARAERDKARALLAELLEETGLKESYTARDGTLHPGATQTVKDVWRFLWGEGRAE